MQRVGASGIGDSHRKERGISGVCRERLYSSSSSSSMLRSESESLVNSKSRDSVCRVTQGEGELALGGLGGLDGAGGFFFRTPGTHKCQYINVY